MRDAVRRLGIEIRAGLHTGEIELADDGGRGHRGPPRSTHRRARAANEVLVSSTVKDLVAGSGIAFAGRGKHELKGVPGKWEVFLVADAASAH